jgi:hypothetical protein
MPIEPSEFCPSHRDAGRHGPQPSEQMLASLARAPSRVFAAWADPEAKGRWFAGPDGDTNSTSGSAGARSTGPRAATVRRWPSSRGTGTSSRTSGSSTPRPCNAGDDLSTVSLTTVELSPVDGGTRLVLTEQGTFLNGREDPSWREQGTNDRLDSITAELKRA